MNCYGIKDTALKWLESYLKDRTQRIVINGSTSRHFQLPFGVPQGSVMGPLIFMLYTGPLAGIIEKHGLHYAIYADDTQLYVIFKSSMRKPQVLDNIKLCIHEIKSWSCKNSLQLNELKTELLHLRSKFRKYTLPLLHLELEGEKISSTHHVRNLGVTLDTNLDMQQHIKNVCKSASFGLSKIGRIRKYLNKSSTEKLVHAFVTSHLDITASLLIFLSSM